MHGFTFLFPFVFQVYNDAVLDCENYTDLAGKNFLDLNNPECLKDALALDSVSELKDTTYNTS